MGAMDEMTPADLVSIGRNMITHLRDILTRSQGLREREAAFDVTLRQQLILFAAVIEECERRSAASAATPKEGL